MRLAFISALLKFVTLRHSGFDKLKDLIGVPRQVLLPDGFQCLVTHRVHISSQLVEIYACIVFDPQLIEVLDGILD